MENSWKKKKEQYTGPVVDTHSHFMPCIDDGPDDMETAVQMLRMAESQGVTDLFVTSHGDFVCERVEFYHKMYRKLVREAKKNHIGIRLYEGCEIFASLNSWDFEGDNDEMKPLIHALNEGVYPAYNGTKFVLIEFDIGVQPPEALYMVKRIQSGGYTVVLAHVERYPFLIREHFVETLVKEGCLVQINANSLVDTKIEIFQQDARYLLEHRLVNFLGSDAHGVEKRPPKMQEGVQYVWENCEEEYALDVIYRNAYRCLIQTV